MEPTKTKALEEIKNIEKRLWKILSLSEKNYYLTCHPHKSTCQDDGVIQKMKDHLGAQGLTL